MKVFPQHTLNALLTGERLNFSTNTIQSAKVLHLLQVFNHLISHLRGLLCDGVNDINFSQ